MLEDALWAKSKTKRYPVDPPTIENHCKDVHRAAVSLWNSVECDISAALKTSLDMLRRELRLLFILAAFLHDIGKANSSFQSLVHGDRKKRQPVRHEILSALLVSGSQFLGQWLRSALTEQEVLAVAWAVGGHHLQMWQQTELDRENPLLRIAGADKTFTIYLGHPEIASLLVSVKEWLGNEGRLLSTPPSFQHRTYTTKENRTDSIKPLLRALVKDSGRLWSIWRSDWQFVSRLAILKSLLIAADVSGSALVAEDLPISEWIASALGSRLDPTDLDPVIATRLKTSQPRSFQRQVASSEHPVTVVAAGCGNGKTVAAYLWAKKWASGRKLFFAYPTTGTTTAGFEDYLLAQTHIERALIHGRAEVDLKAMVVSPEDDLFEETIRLESLKAWRQQVIACTVDTILGLIQNQRRGLFSSPAITCGAFVFDEIHNYDKRLFGELLTFLRMFPGTPVLLMSASVPPTRLDALRRTLGDRMGEIIPGEPELENRPRYWIESRSSPQECWPEVLRSLEQKEKVLWVCNTVGDAVNVFEQALAQKVSSIVYHSRFRYRDRVNRQKEVLAAFEPNAKSCLIVSTQVCEMSLDINADLLVTALAPLPSLVQRMGRLNRFAEEGIPARPCLVYPFIGKPYDSPEHKNEMNAAERTIEALAKRPCSQADLASYLNEMQTSESWTQTSAWLDGGWQSKPLPPREGGYTVTVIREEDIAEIARELGPERFGRWTSQQLVPWTIPMLLSSSYVLERRIGGYPLAPLGTIDYDLTEGARWHKKTKL
ncbi:MAG: CRISPR-associated helicase Cas3' [Candidatus Rokubacteria bacterium]|nr:CRISPR-associated helicase Cas3' [Candidatus Rokubacteria bacterium]